MKNPEIKILVGFNHLLCQNKYPNNKKVFSGGDKDNITEIPKQVGLLDYLRWAALHAPQMEHIPFMRCDHMTEHAKADLWLCSKSDLRGSIEGKNLKVFKERKDFEGLCRLESPRVVITDRMEYVYYARKAGVEHVIYFDHEFTSAGDKKEFIPKLKNNEFYVAKCYNKIKKIMRVVLEESLWQQEAA